MRGARLPDNGPEEVRRCTSPVTPTEFRMSFWQRCVGVSIAVTLPLGLAACAGGAGQGFQRSGQNSFVGGEQGAV